MVVKDPLTCCPDPEECIRMMLCPAVGVTIPLLVRFRVPSRLIAPVVSTVPLGDVREGKSSVNFPPDPCV